MNQSQFSEFPPDVGNWSQIQTLSARDTQLRGEIPPALGNLVQSAWSEPVTLWTAAEATQVFPLLVSSPGQFTGLALANQGAETATLTFAAFGEGELDGLPTVSLTICGIAY